MIDMPVMDLGVFYQLAPMLVLLFGGLVMMVSGAVSKSVGRFQRFFNGIA